MADFCDFSCLIGIILCREWWWEFLVGFHREKLFVSRQCHIVSTSSVVIIDLTQNDVNILPISTYNTPCRQTADAVDSLLLGGVVLGRLAAKLEMFYCLSTPIGGQIRCATSVMAVGLMKYVTVGTYRHKSLDNEVFQWRDEALIENWPSRRMESPNFKLQKYNIQYLHSWFCSVQHIFEFFPILPHQKVK